MKLSCRIIVLASASIWRLFAGDPAYIITYSHQMEEPGNLEIEFTGTTGKPGGGNRFLGGAAEFEYGVKGWWTTEVYLDGTAAANESTIFTGYRWENRFRLLPREHWINPVLYVEFENINGADKALREVVGFDSEEDLAAPLAEARVEKQREMEAKLILGSYWKGWNFSENFIAEKNVKHEPYEFGYAVGISRPLRLEAEPRPCRVCAENWQAGVEMFGGLGTHEDFGLRGTSHYVAPVVAWALPSGVTFRVSPAFGVTTASAPFLMRVGMTYEIQQFRRMVRGWLSQ